MAQYTHDEYTSVWWVTSISSISAPTAAEIAAGVNLTTFVSKDGLKVGATNNVVKNDNLSTAFAGEIPGTYGNKASLKCFRDNTADTAWNTLSTRNTSGYLVVRRGVTFATTIAAGQKVEVYPARTQQPLPEDSAENTRVMVQFDLAIHSTPALASTVA